MYRPLKRCKGQRRSAMIADFARNSDLYKLPELISLSAPEVSVNTGKGVVVNYAPPPSPEKNNKKGECSYSVSNAIRTLAMVREAGLEPARA